MKGPVEQPPGVLFYGMEGDALMLCVAASRHLMNDR